MTKKEKELFERFDRHIHIMQQIADAMPKPESKFTSMLNTALVVVGIFSVVGIADTIIRWIAGGQ